MLSCFTEYAYWSNRAEENLYDIYRFRRERLLQALQDSNDDVVGKCKHDRYSMTVYLRHFYVVFEVMHPITNKNTSDEIGLYIEGNRLCLYKFVLESNEQFFTAVKEIVNHINSYLAKNKKERQNAMRNIRTSG